MGETATSGLGKYWERDVARHGLLADGLGGRLWNLRPARGWASIATAITALLGVNASAILIATPRAEFFGIPSAIWAVFIWVPWLALLLGVMHTVRVIAIRNGLEEPEEVFVAVCTGTGSSARVARAVRRAVARVYGVPAELIAATDTGWTLSRFMESPATVELSGVIIEELGSVRDVEQLVEEIGSLRASATVAHLARRVMDAQWGR